MSVLAEAGLNSFAYWHTVRATNLLATIATLPDSHPLSRFRKAQTNRRFRSPSQLWMEGLDIRPKDIKVEIRRTLEPWKSRLPIIQKEPEEATLTKGWLAVVASEGKTTQGHAGGVIAATMDQTRQSPTPFTVQSILKNSHCFGVAVELEAIATALRCIPDRGSKSIHIFSSNREAPRALKGERIEVAESLLQIYETATKLTKSGFRATYLGYHLTHDLRFNGSTKGATRSEKLTVLWSGNAGTGTTYKNQSEKITKYHTVISGLNGMEMSN